MFRTIRPNLGEHRSATRPAVKKLIIITLKPLYGGFGLTETLGILQRYGQMNRTRESLREQCHRIHNITPLKRNHL